MTENTPDTTTPATEQPAPRSLSDASPPWLDLPPCPECEDGGLVGVTVHPEDDHPATEDGMYPSEELGALNDIDDPQWGWCRKCCKNVDIGIVGYKKADRADEWWERPDRDQAWADVQRKRRVDAVAVEHAARQTSLFDDAVTRRQQADADVELALVRQSAAERAEDEAWKTKREADS